MTVEPTKPRDPEPMLGPVSQWRRQQALTAREPDPLTTMALRRIVAAMRLDEATRWRP
jgi:hypothetical protein